MMEKNEETFFENFLKGEGLLKNKGIRYEAWDEYEKARKVLPGTGKKSFEPSGSWLQQKQVEKGLQHRKDLLFIERVERKSQLAVVEWLPNEKKARVVKKSGQEWTNFGTEVNSVLYLLPEEALLLLEMNCIELTWEGLAMSVQQAYSILIDSEKSGCSLEEYKVYSQFVKFGYRLQRCLSNVSLKKRTNARESTLPRRKIIVWPLDDLRMSPDLPQSQNNIVNIQKNGCSTKPPQVSQKSLEVLRNENDHCDVIEEKVQELVENIICNLESKELEVTPSNTELSQFKTLDGHSDCDHKNTKSNRNNHNLKVEIISDETVLDSIKILRDTSQENNSTEKSSSKVPCLRIKRNVKLLPKRMNKPFSANDPRSSQIIENTKVATKNEKGSLSTSGSSVSEKKRQEVIELSDDEIEEVHKPLTKSEILNQLPNIALPPLKVTQISLRNFIPHNIKPRIDAQLYEKWKRSSVQGTDNCNRLPGKTDNRQYPALKRNTNGNYANPNQRAHFFNRSFNGQVNNFQQNNYRAMQQSNQFLDLEYWQWHNRKIFLQQNPHLQVNNYNNILVGLMQNIIKAHMIQNHFLRNFPFNLQAMPSVPSQRFFVDRRQGVPCPRETSKRKGNFNQVERAPTLDKVDKSTTWQELKKKWQDERTITIDHEDLQESLNEIELVQEEIKPLITIKRNTQLVDINDKLKLIKTSTEKSQRQKELDYKISYNVYSNGSNFKKANPGSPICRLLVLREDEDHYLNSVEVRQLPTEKDTPLVIAHVTRTSVSYIQLGNVLIPDLI